MPVTVLVAYAIFLVVAFGFRAALHYRQTGTTGIVGISGRSFSVEWLGGVLFVLAAVGDGLAAPLAEIVGWVASWHGERTHLGYALGALLAAVGIAGTMWAQLAVGKS